jgi:hypothetical protein
MANFLHAMHIIRRFKTHGVSDLPLHAFIATPYQSSLSSSDHIVI